MLVWCRGCCQSRAQTQPVVGSPRGIINNVISVPLVEIRQLQPLADIHPSSVCIGTNWLLPTNATQQTGAPYENCVCVRSECMVAVRGTRIRLLYPDTRLFITSLS